MIGQINKMNHAAIKKLVIFLVLCPVLLFSCVFSGGCTTRADGKDVNIVATVFPAYDIIRELTAGIPEFSIRLLLRPGTESHTYDPSVNDAVAISECDLLVYAGGDADTWVEKFLSSGVSDQGRSFELMSAVNEKLMIEGEDEEDPHVWTDPQNVILIASALREKLLSVVGGKGLGNAVSDKIIANSDRFIGELEALDNEFASLSARISAEKRLLAFGDRFPFRYFCKRYGFSACAVFPGCAEESEPAASDVKKVVDAIRENKLDTVFYVELSSHRIADAIAAETGCKTACLHSCHNLSKEDFDAGETYLSLMRRNLETLSRLAVKD